MFSAQQDGEASHRKFTLLLSRLKTWDVVKVSCCRQDLCGDELLDAVFHILKHNFGELPWSNLPMRGFYTTVPKAGEVAMAYWVRLYKAIDAAGECLHRRGRWVEDQWTRLCHDVHYSMS